MLIRLLKIFWPKDWTILKKTVYHSDETFHVTDYIYNGKKFKCIGDPDKKNARGFFVPIQKCTWNGKDVTGYVKKFAGPRQDFYGKDPNISKMFFKVTAHKFIPRFKVRQDSVGIEVHIEYVIEPEQGTLEVTNIFNQVSIFGAK